MGGQISKKISESKQTHDMPSESDKSREKNKVGNGVCRWSGKASKEVTWSRGVGCIWKKTAGDRRNNMCKGTEAGESSFFLSNAKVLVLLEHFRGAAE